jgi:hypothetical protein
MAGVRAGTRFQKKDPVPSKNLYGFITFSPATSINLSSTLSATIIETSYMRGMIYGLNSNLDLVSGKIFAGFGYQYIDYLLTTSEISQIQHLADINLSWRVYRKISLTANYERTFESKSNYNQLYLQLRLGF